MNAHEWFILSITTTPQFHRWDERCESQGKYLKDGAANNFHLNNYVIHQANMLFLANTDR